MVFRGYDSARLVSLSVCVSVPLYALNALVDCVICLKTQI